ncbi:Hypothetical protein (plasmid) [Pseudomonas putida]|nr:Hypothetical protein [Pseudomonas putida]
MNGFNNDLYASGVRLVFVFDSGFFYWLGHRSHLQSYSG